MVRLGLADLTDPLRRRSAHQQDIRARVTRNGLPGGVQRVVSSGRVIAEQPPEELVDDLENARPGAEVDIDCELAAVLLAQQCRAAGKRRQLILRSDASPSAPREARRLSITTLRDRCRAQFPWAQQRSAKSSAVCSV